LTGQAPDAAFRRFLHDKDLRTELADDMAREMERRGARLIDARIPVPEAATAV